MDLTGYVHLLLGAPGQAAPALPVSEWRLWAVSDEGLADPTAVAAATRPSPMTARAEKALLAAVAADDVDALGRLAAQAGGVQDAARLLYAGRLVAVDRVLATEMLIALLSAPTDPSASKALHRHWGNLHVGVTLAPGVPALIPVSRLAVGLLLAEVCTADERPLDAVAVLRQIPPQPAVTLALAATLLGMGEHDQVIEVTARAANVDDVAALALVARSVAARMLSDLPTALDAASAALVVPERSGSVLASALEERARVHAQAGNDAAARADLEALTALTGGAADVEIPPVSPLTAGVAGAGSEDDELHRARDRVRRRIMGVGAPGTFGGRHHSTYRDDVADMFALGRTDAVEELLLGLLDAVEDEVVETGAPLDPTFFLTLIDLYEDSGRTEDLVALRERFEAAKSRDARGPVLDVDQPQPGERRAGSAPFDAPPPVDVDAVSIDGQPMDMGAAVEHLLVSVGVAAPVLPVSTAVSEAAPAEPASSAPAPVAEPEPEPEPVPVAEPEPVASTEPEPESVASPEPVPVAKPDGPEPGVTEPVVAEPDVTEPDDESLEDVLDEDAGPGADDAAPADEAERSAEARATMERVARGPRIRSL